MNLNGAKATDSETAAESDSDEPDDPASSDDNRSTDGMSSIGNSRHSNPPIHISDLPVTTATTGEAATTEAGGMPNVDHLGDLPEDFTYDEMPIALLMRESLPGLNYEDVNPLEAAFVVASNPLTKTHTWNPMPRNSIMWCTRGQMPELRLLRSKKPKHRSIVSDHTIVL